MKPSLKNKILAAFDVLWFLIRHGGIEGAERHVRQERQRLMRELYGSKL